MRRIYLILVLALTMFTFSGSFNVTKAGFSLDIEFTDCMFTDNGSNTYECFCSGDGKNFFKIECTQAEFNFCKNDVLGEVKRLLVVDTIDNPPPPGGSYSFDLECALIVGSN